MRKKRSSGLESLFFDLDGTLVDSAPDIRVYLYESLRENNLSPEELSDRFRIGPPLETMIRNMVPDITEKHLGSVVASFRRRYDQSDYPLTLPFKGIEPLLAELVAMGIPLHVATNKPSFSSKRILHKMGWHFFETVLSPDSMEGERLTKTQLLQRISLERNYRPEDCILIGDLPEDVAAAQKAGFRSAGVTWGYGEAAALSRCGADWLVSEPAQLIAIGKELFHV